MKLLLLIILAIANPVAAQILVQSGPSDPRFQSLEYRADKVYLLDVAPGYQTAVVFAASEEVQTIALGDSGSWQITPNSRGDTIFLRAREGARGTNMTVVTDARTYVFDLNAGGINSPWVVRMTYPATQGGIYQPRENAGPKGTYRVRGTRALFPVGLEDDGDKTFIRWPEGTPMPAVFAKNESGKEMVVDGQMRDDIFVIDRVYSKLVFRLDKKKATARRKKTDKK